MLICCYPLRLQQLLWNNKSISCNFISPNGHELHSLAHPVVAILSLRPSWKRWVTQLPWFPSHSRGRESQAWSSTICLHLDWQLPMTVGLTLLWQHSCSCHLSPSHMIAQPSQSNSSSQDHKLQQVFHLLFSPQWLWHQFLMAQKCWVGFFVSFLPNKRLAGDSCLWCNTSFCYFIVNQCPLSCSYRVSALLLEYHFHSPIETNSAQMHLCITVHCIYLCLEKLCL